jgi:FHA domain-containing protein/type VI secretion system protein
MLLIRAISFKGQPTEREIVGRFEEAGGTIGRGANSTMVLPDPDRYISRTHATISFQAGGFLITDNGTRNPLMLNDRSLGPGSQARLAHGDRIQLGGYTLEVALIPSQNRLGNVAPVDPFADLVKARPDRLPEPSRMRPAEPMPPPRPDPLIPPMPQYPSRDPLADLHGREASIDELLGLKGSVSREPVGASSQQPPLPRSGEQLPLDPLQMLGGPVKPIPPPTIPDDAWEIFTPYAPPAAKLDPALAPRREEIPIPAAVPPPTRVSPEAPAAPPRVSPELPPPSRAVVDRPGEPALLAAFLRGAGIVESQLPGGLTAETLEAIGRVLREAIQGTLDLLRARGLTKSEMRADVTVITAVDNNPLKFSPTVEVALGHLLAPHGRGFLPPLRAIQEAYDDLRAHQFGVLAGMRAALEEVLARFAPSELEQQLSEPSALDSLLPINRKAKEWDLFVEHYETIAGQAREDFNAVFGSAFRRAYEAQVRQLRAQVRQG